jgi:hypothetical protein
MDDWALANLLMGLLVPIPLLLAVRWIEVQFERPHATAAQ